METRQLILQKNYEAILKHGFQGARADKAIQELGITKGAMYYYFPSKAELGYAVVDEVIRPMFVNNWKRLAVMPGHPVDNIATVLRDVVGFTDDENIKLGCPLNNLMQEMSPLDDGFRQRLAAILSAMQASIAQALEAGKANGQIVEGCHPQGTALYILSTLEGAFGMAKVFQRREVLVSAIENLVCSLQGLKA